MSEKRTIARPYARALFAELQGQDPAVLSSYSQLLALLAQVVVVDAVDQVIKNPVVSREQVVSLLLDIANEANLAAVGCWIRRGPQRPNK